MVDKQIERHTDRHRGVNRSLVISNRISDAEPSQEGYQTLYPSMIHADLLAARPPRRGQYGDGGSTSRNRGRTCRRRSKPSGSPRFQTCGWCGTAASEPRPPATRTRHGMRRAGVHRNARPKGVEAVRAPIGSDARRVAKGRCDVDATTLHILPRSQGQRVMSIN